MTGDSSFFSYDRLFAFSKSYENILFMVWTKIVSDATLWWTLWFSTGQRVAWLWHQNHEHKREQRDEQTIKHTDRRTARQTYSQSDTHTRARTRIQLLTKYYFVLFLNTPAVWYSVHLESSCEYHAPKNSITHTTEYSTQYHYMFDNTFQSIRHRWD